MSNSEKIQLILQYLQLQGYEQAAKQLEEESNTQLQPQHITQLKQALQSFDLQSIESILNDYLSKETKTKCMLIILEQVYIRYLLNKDIQSAVELLRTQISQYCPDEESKHHYASMVVSKQLQLKDHSQLVNDILYICHHELGVIEPNRFVSLILQSEAQQVTQCTFHKVLPRNYSVLNQHYCSDSVEYVIIEKQNVTHCVFSKDYLAIAYNKNKIGLIELKNTKKEDNFKELDSAHIESILSLTFSPCQKYLASTSTDRTANIYKIGERKSYKLKGHADIVTGLQWFGDMVYTISNDGWLYEWANDVRKGGLKVEEKLISILKFNDSFILVSNNKVSLYRTYTKALLSQITKIETIRNAACNDTYLILNISRECPRIELHSLPTLTIIRQFVGFIQHFSPTKCQLGWHYDNLIATASDGGTMCLWHINGPTTPIMTIQGNTNSQIGTFAFHPITQKLQIYKEGTRENTKFDLPTLQQGPTTHGFSAILHLIQSMTRTRVRQESQESSDEDR